MSFRSLASEAARASAGSFKTRAARLQISGQLADWLQARNIQIRTFDQLKPKHLQAWIADCKAQGLSDRTLQNRLSVIRNLLRESGLTRKADQIQTKDFGISGASRDGTRRGISAEAYQVRIVQVSDPGVRACLELQRVLGLRQREAIMAQRDTLERWERELEHGSRVKILDGTKGGRERETLIHDRADALETVRAALAVSELNRGRLIAASDLKSAVDRFNNQARAAGFIGQFSPHSIRYAFARKAVESYKAAGLTEREALLCTSRDLGHGDGRGRWVNQVYLR